MKLSRSTIRSLNSAGNSIAKVTANTAEKAVTGIFRFATTDHTGITQRLINMPKMGLLDSLKYILLQLLFSVLGAIVAGVLTFLLIAYGIPFVFHSLL